MDLAGNPRSTRHTADGTARPVAVVSLAMRFEFHRLTASMPPRFFERPEHDAAGSGTRARGLKSDERTSTRLEGEG